MRADPQKNRVYGWEEEHADWNRCTLTLSQTREYVRKACKLYRLKPPAVRQHRDNRLPWSEFYFISFRARYRNPATALHETAHYICDSIFGDDPAQQCPQDHGPEWLGIYLWLLEHFKILPRRELHTGVSALRLSWWPASAVSPSALRNRARKPVRGGSRTSRQHGDR